VIDLALTVIILLSAAGGGLFGFLYGYAYGGLHADRTNSAKVHGKDRGHRSGNTRGLEGLAGWESSFVLPLEAQGKLATDVYSRKD